MASLMNTAKHLRKKSYHFSTSHPETRGGENTSLLCAAYINLIPKLDKRASQGRKTAVQYLMNTDAKITEN